MMDLDWSSGAAAAHCLFGALLEAKRCGRPQYVYKKPSGDWIWTNSDPHESYLHSEMCGVCIQVLPDGHALMLPGKA